MASASVPGQSIAVLRKEWARMQHNVWSCNALASGAEGPVLRCEGTRVADAIIKTGMSPSSACDAPCSHELSETLVHNQADLTQPRRIVDADTSMRGRLRACLLGDRRRRRSAVMR